MVRAPAALVVLGQLKVEALVSHADRDPPDARPRIEVRAESVEPAMMGRARKSDEAECCSEELAALVEHGLLDHVVRLQHQQRGRIEFNTVFRSGGDAAISLRSFGLTVVLVVAG